MKKIMVLTIALFAAPLFAGPYCIDKQENSLDCPCNCDVIKGRHCIDCFHLQDARPLTIVSPSFAPLSPRLQSAGKASPYAKATEDRSEGTAKKNKVVKSHVYRPKDPQTVLEKLAAQYMENKYDI